MNYIEPKPLKKGDTIAFIAPAGAVRDIKAIERAKKYFETNGYNVVYSKHLLNINKYFSDTDENRLADLHEAFKNPKIDAIICARGGYGCLRLVDKIDYDLIKNNPKIFCGYSDITVLSAMFLKRSGLITYSGAMAKGDFGAEKISDFTTANFYKAVEQKEKLSFTAQKTCNTVQAKGTLFGGNLASVVSLCGIEFLPDEDFIFFCEDLNEPVYKIDKMLTQLLNMKNFRTNVKAVVTGDFLECGYPEQLDELFFDISKELNIPVFGGFKITHNKDKITLPYGKCAIVENDKLMIC